jgi:hypothetical protein
LYRDRRNDRGVAALGSERILKIKEGRKKEDL